MKIGQTAKQIDAVLNPVGYYNHDKPAYMGETTIWNKKQHKWETVNSTFVARKYSQIIELVQDTGATVKVGKTAILITYNEGKGVVKIGRDLLVDTFLLPQLKH